MKSIVAGRRDLPLCLLLLEIIKNFDWTRFDRQITLQADKVADYGPVCAITVWRFGIERPGVVGREKMKPVSFILLSGGWAIVVAALMLLPPSVSRPMFVLAGIGVEILGLILAIRAHRILEVERG